MKPLKARTLFAILTFLLAAGLFPASAGAYSYGNANTEAMAETFKLTAGKMAADNPDWAAAQAAYAEVKTEIQSHLGKEVTAEMDAAYAAKDKDRVMKDWKGVLALNLNRRFVYAEQSFSNYSEAKLLLAKARATYEALKPYLTGTPAESKLTELDQAFDQALEALGNPGLLGVGKKEPNPEAFKQNIKLIYDNVAPHFRMEGAAGDAVTADPTASQAPHAPMKEASKTNTTVTIVAIAVVLAAAGLLFWRLRGRKSS